MSIFCLLLDTEFKGKGPAPSRSGSPQTFIHVCFVVCVCVCVCMYVCVSCTSTDWLMYRHTLIKTCFIDSEQQTNEARMGVIMKRLDWYEQLSSLVTHQNVYFCSRFSALDLQLSVLLSQHGTIDPHLVLSRTTIYKSELVFVVILWLSGSVQPSVHFFARLISPFSLA